MNNQVDLRQALAVAIYAFQTNNNQVVKTIHNAVNPDCFVNRCYLDKYFSDKKIMEQIPDFTLSQELLEQADSMRQTIDYYVTIETLTKSYTNEFLNTIHRLVQHDQIHSKNFGILVWAPKLVHDYNERNNIREISLRLETQSKFIGKVKDSVTVDFTLIEKRWVRNCNCWAAYGHTPEGNLVKFLTKHENLCVNGMIRGKIKSIDNDTYRNMARVTTLNHVKTV